MEDTMTAQPKAENMTDEGRQKTATDSAGKLNEGRSARLYSVVINRVFMIIKVQAE